MANFIWERVEEALSEINTIDYRPFTAAVTYVKPASTINIWQATNVSEALDRACVLTTSNCVEI